MQRSVHSSQQSTADSHHHTPATHDSALTDEVLVQRALEGGTAAASYTPAMVRALSRTVGNGAVQRLIQRAAGAISPVTAPVIQRDIDDQIVEHSYDKHVLGIDNGAKGKEFGDPPITKAQLKTLATDVRTSGASKALARGRTAYWKDGVIVIVNGSNPSASTCFKANKDYFDRQA